MFFLIVVDNPSHDLAFTHWLNAMLKIASKQIPSLKNKRVSPHTLRHTCATHILRSKVDINTIRALLGHVSIDTTNIYAETDLEMKAKALALCEVKESRKAKHWHEDSGLIRYLKAL